MTENEKAIARTAMMYMGRALKEGADTLSRLEGVHIFPLVDSNNWTYVHIFWTHRDSQGFETDHQVELHGYEARVIY